MCSTLFEINLEAYTLKEFSAIKLGTSAVEVVFQENVQNEIHNNDEPFHGQLKCSNLAYPFAKEGYKPCALPMRRAGVLVNADPIANVKEVIEIELDSSLHPTLDYSPGDTIAVLPQNAEEEVLLLLESIKLLDKADKICEVQFHPADSKKSVKFPHIPKYTTPRELLRDILNIRAVPKKQFLRALANCCSSIKEQNFLNSLASKEGNHYYNELFLEKGLTLTQLLKVCVSCTPTLALLIEHLPRLLPRPYSIANSPRGNGNSIKIIFSTLSQRPGITTAMLSSMAHALISENLISHPAVLLYPRETNNFRYTQNDFENNQILIAIGTGLAPFLGFLEHKAHLFSKSTKKPGSTWLFVGATTEASVLHRTDILDMREKYNDQLLEQYFESFSRVPDAKFHYVQEQMAAHAKELIELLLKDETTLYVCADGARISKTIESSLCLCMQQELCIGADEAMDMLKQFRLNGKYREDLWV